MNLSISISSAAILFSLIVGPFLIAKAISELYTRLSFQIESTRSALSFASVALVGVPTIVDRGALGAVLKALKQSLDKRSYAVLQCVRLRCAPHTLYVESTNIDDTFILEVPLCQKNLQGSCLVDLIDLLNTVESFDSDRLYLSLKDGLLRLSIDDDSADLITRLSDDFPIFPIFPLNLVSVDYKKWVTATDYVLPFISKDDARPNICGAHFRFFGGLYTLCSTDGHRLALSELEISSDFLDEITVSSSALLEIKRKFKKCEHIKIGIDGDYLFVQGREKSSKWDNVHASFRLISGKYPDIDKVIPTREKGFPVDRKALLKTASAFRKLTVKGGLAGLECIDSHAILSVDSRSKNLGECKYFSKVKLNIDYLVAALKTMKSDIIYISAESALSPVLLFESDDNNMTLIMPIH